MFLEATREGKPHEFLINYPTVLSPGLALPVRSVSFSQICHVYSDDTEIVDVDTSAGKKVDHVDDALHTSAGETDFSRACIDFYILTLLPH